MLFAKVKIRSMNRVEVSQQVVENRKFLGRFVGALRPVKYHRPPSWRLAIVVATS